MVHEDRSRKKYPSDLTDEPWAIVGPMIPPAKQNPRGGRPRKVDRREVLNTLFSLNRSGCQWDMVPHDVLPKSTVYDSFSQWPSGVTMGHGRNWSGPCASGPVWKRGASRPPVPPASRVNRSRPPRGEARSADMMAAKKSTGASDICWWRRWGCCWPS